MAKIKDTDYLSISARIRAMENHLLTKERMERMLRPEATRRPPKSSPSAAMGSYPPSPTRGLTRCWAMPGRSYTTN